MKAKIIAQIIITMSVFGMITVALTYSCYAQQLCSLRMRARGHCMWVLDRILATY